MTPPTAPALEQRPRHPFWCDECGGKAPFTIKGSPIRHHRDCPHHGETYTDAERLYEEAKAWCLRNPGRSIP